MLALDKRRRDFVWALLRQKKSDQAKAAEEAGFCPIETSQSKNRDGLMRKMGSMLAHEEEVLAAIQEVAGKEIRAAALPAVRAMLELVRNPKAKGHRNAVESILDRSGHGAAQKITVDHTHRDLTSAAMAERIAELAKKHGFDPAQMLGRGAPAMIDVTPEVKNAE